jgi:uncharacterized membrane protein YkoI
MSLYICTDTICAYSELTQSLPAQAEDCAAENIVKEYALQGEYMKHWKTKIFCLILLAIAFISLGGSGIPERNSQAVPDAVLKAAHERLDNFMLLGSKLESEGERKVYKLIGVADERIYRLEIDPKGHILRVQKKREVEGLPLTYIPSEVIESAKNAREGIVLIEASVEREQGKLVYEIIGKVGPKCYEIEVSSAGNILEVGKCD